MKTALGIFVVQEGEWEPIVWVDQPALLEAAIRGMLREVRRAQNQNRRESLDESQQEGEEDEHCP
ncbi:MAG: hypothetical protein K6U75_15630 [Firmicutes bacterium]|nr:hypothetical protein [Bacillota bacterium]